MASIGYLQNLMLQSTRSLFRRYAKKYYSTDTRKQFKGWVKSVRKHKDLVFVDISDGSSLHVQQVVMNALDCPSNVTLGSSIHVEGQMVKNPREAESYDLEVESLRIVGPCPSEDYPFKPRKPHPLDYVRQYPHLRARTNVFSAVTRVRQAATMCIHQYLQSSGYTLVHTPILTSNDCEGAGELFLVQTQDGPERLDTEKKREENGFFNTPVYLTVSGQLHAEALACGLSKVYTFGPTFRADKSHTRRHLAEFYMLEVEMCFLESLNDLLVLLENLYKCITSELLEKCAEDIGFLHKQVKIDLKTELMKNVNSDFRRLTYTEAVDILKNHKDMFELEPPQWGEDLKSEHEQFIVCHLGNKPVFVVDYPVSLKPFYARPVDGDSTVVSAVDLLVPGLGELAGGSVREERYEPLKTKLTQLGLQDSYEWYLDLRRFGTVPHGGFGLGFERYLQHILGVEQIRDVIPFPRYLGSCQT